MRSKAADFWSVPPITDGSKLKSDGDESDAEITYLLDFARKLPVQGTKTVHVPPRDGKSARDAHLTIGFAPLSIQSPIIDRRKSTISAWVVRVWEPRPPAGVDEPLEWILVTSVPTNTLPDAAQRADWYTCRWLVEDYHKCLKTGCNIEKRRLADVEGLFRLLGVFAPVAVYLLQLREISRLDPERLAQSELPPDLINIVAALADLDPEAMTIGRFWREVARQGGFLGRRGDGKPGWQTICERMAAYPNPPARHSTSKETTKIDMWVKLSPVREGESVRAASVFVFGPSPVRSLTLAD